MQNADLRRKQTTMHRRDAAPVECTICRSRFSAAHNVSGHIIVLENVNGRIGSDTRKLVGKLCIAITVGRDRLLVLHRDAFQSRKRVEQLKQENPEQATMAEDWINWRQAANSVDTEALCHALNLQRDPSRGRTHIVFRQAVYTPNDSKSIRKKFQVVNCSVYRIEDVLTDIEDFMDLNGGEGRAYIQGLIDELIEGDHTGDGVPILELKLAPGLEIYLGYLMSSRSKLRQITYNSHWRELMNPKSPPGPMPPLKSGAQDAEFRF